MIAVDPGMGIRRVRRALASTGAVAFIGRFAWLGLGAAIAAAVILFFVLPARDGNDADRDVDKPRQASEKSADQAAMQAPTPADFDPEIATAGPGYGFDEPMDALGQDLKEPAPERLPGGHVVGHQADGLGVGLGYTTTGLRGRLGLQLLFTLERLFRIRGDDEGCRHQLRDQGARRSRPRDR